MGYTHYFRRIPEIPQDKFDAIGADFRKIVDAVEEAGIKICDSLGEGDVLITPDEIGFNGDANCGHERRDLGIAWPSDNAGGVDVNGETEGNWFAGALLATRTCGGDCSHESVLFRRVYEPYSDSDTPENGKHFEFCKTAYKPYDIAVTAFLIICKHYLGDDIRVSSDGDNKDWLDAKMLCDKVLNYGLAYYIGEEGLQKVE